MPEQSLPLTHAITVAKLRELTDRLQPDDWLLPNAVFNLLVVRGNQAIGMIDCDPEQPSLDLWDAA